LGQTSIRSQRREQILDGLFQAMAHRQTDAVSISDIASSANIARGALHYYFESKDEIRSCLMEKLGRSYIKNLNHHIFDKETPTDRDLIERLVRFHLAPSVSQKTADLMGVWIEYWGQASTDPVLNQIVMSTQEDARQTCLEVMLRTDPRLTAIPRGDLREASATILALIEGGLLQSRVALRTDAPLNQQKLQRHVILSIRSFLDSLSLAIAETQSQSHEDTDTHDAI
jgi:AcrR family transcriptional regulator